MVQLHGAGSCAAGAPGPDYGNTHTEMVNEGERPGHRELDTESWDTAPSMGGGAGHGLETVNLDFVGLCETVVDERQTDVLALIALHLNDQAVGRVVNHSPVRVELLLPVAEYLLLVEFLLESLHSS